MNVCDPPLNDRSMFGTMLVAFAFMFLKVTAFVIASNLS